jgi:hypothetical protein
VPITAKICGKKDNLDFIVGQVSKLGVVDADF